MASDLDNPTHRLKSPQHAHLASSQAFSTLQESSWLITRDPSLHGTAPGSALDYPMETSFAGSAIAISAWFSVS